MQEEKKKISHKASDSVQACEESKESLQAKRSKERFVEGVLARGEAAKPVRGKLPPGATHEIVKKRGKEGLPEIRRRRFSTT